MQNMQNTPAARNPSVRRPVPPNKQHRPGLDLPAEQQIRQVFFERTRGWKRETGLGVF